MKYFTKEYYALEWLSYAGRYVKKSKGAERRDEAFYQRTYKKQCEIFVSHDNMSDWYRDVFGELRRLEDAINDPDITEGERVRRRQFKKIYLNLNRRRIARGQAYEFDAELSKRKFAERNKAQIEIYSRLPQEILDKIADIRVFALGYASAEVIRLLRPYCAELQKKLLQIKDRAYTETNEAESCLTEELGLNDYNDCLITGIEKKNGDVYLKGEENNFLLVKDGEIIEGQEKTIHPYDTDTANCPWSRIIAAELHRAKDAFEVHFLVSNCDECEREELWYLTIRGTDIRKTS